MNYGPIYEQNRWINRVCLRVRLPYAGHISFSTSFCFQLNPMRKEVKQWASSPATCIHPPVITSLPLTPWMGLWVLLEAIPADTGWRQSTPWTSSSWMRKNIKYNKVVFNKHHFCNIQGFSFLVTLCPCYCFSEASVYWTGLYSADV